MDRMVERVENESSMTGLDPSNIIEGGRRVRGPVANTAKIHASEVNIPEYYKEITSNKHKEKWAEALRQEMKSLEKLKVFEIAGRWILRLRTYTRS